MKLCASHPCPIQVSESLFDILQKSVQCLHLRHPGYDFHGLVCCPNLCCASVHEQECIQTLHSLICKGVCLHSDHDLNGSYELFGSQFPSNGLRLVALVLWIGLCKVWRYAGLGVRCDSLCHCVRATLRGDSDGSLTGRGDPKRTKVGISLLPAHLYTENRHQVRNKADIMKTGPDQRWRRGLL